MNSGLVHAGIARRVINPNPGVELAGWGYYLERTWTGIHDDLFVTACCFEYDGEVAVVVALDLMTIGVGFTQHVREKASRATGIPGNNILLTASHSHNAPTTGALLGVGQEDSAYVDFVVNEAVEAIVSALKQRVPVRLAVATGSCAGLTFNRTRENGPVDTTLTVLRVDVVETGEPIAVLINFQAHPTVLTELMPTKITRDVPGQICDAIEMAFPTATAMYLQGACGDVNFHREYVDSNRYREPGRAISKIAIEAVTTATPTQSQFVKVVNATAALPVRHWTQEELDADRIEAARRLAERDLSGWRETIGRVMVNRPDDMVARHGGDEWKAVEAMCRFQVEWTDRMIDQARLPLHLDAEVQVIRLGDLAVAANATEFFTMLALDVRARSPAQHLMIAAYSNGRIGYLPDAHDVRLRTYAAYQSPKYCSQLPFVEVSGNVMCDTIVDAVTEAMS